MKKWLLGITCMLMMLGLIFSAGCGRQPASPASDRLEVRNNGTAIRGNTAMKPIGTTLWLLTS